MSSKINEDLSHLLNNLGKLKENKKATISDINQIEEEIKIARKYLNQYPPQEDSHNLNDLKSYVLAYDDGISKMVQQSVIESANVASGYQIVSGTASHYMNYNHEALTGIISEIDISRKSRQDHTIVYDGLLNYSQTIANMFISAWQMLEAGSFDPARGPAFLIRESISQFLSLLAPNDKVKNKDWWSPHSNHVEVTRNHRIKYIFEELIIDEGKNEMTYHQLKSLDRLYNSLSSAHDRKELDITKIKSMLYETQDILKSVHIFLKPLSN